MKFIRRFSIRNFNHFKVQVLFFPDKRYWVVRKLSSAMSSKRKSEGQPAAAKKAAKTSGDIHPFFKSSKHNKPGSSEAESAGSKIIWGAESPGMKPDSLLLGRTEDFSFSGFDWVLALDLDGTLIRVKGTHVHAKSADDWQWHNSKVIETLKKYKEEGAGIAIFTNQGGLDPSKSIAKGGDRLTEFQSKIQQISHQVNFCVGLIRQALFVIVANWH